MSETIEKTGMFTYVRRAVLLSFTLGLIAATVLMVVSGGIFARAEEGTYRLGLGPLTFFHVTKEILAQGGTTAQITPGLGVLLLVGVLPALAGLLAYLAKKKKPVEPAG